MSRRTGLVLATLVAMGCGSVSGTNMDAGGGAGGPAGSAGTGGSGSGSAGSAGGASGVAGAAGASSGGSGGGAGDVAGAGGGGAASAGSGGRGGAAGSGGASAGSGGRGGAAGSGGASAGRGGSGGVAGASGATGVAGVGGGPAGAGGGGAGGSLAGTNVRVFVGQTAIVLQSGPACTSQEGATGDRWCAFAAASPTSANAFDLFVVNISRAAAGVAVTCGPAPDPNCLRLTAQFAEDESHPAFFQGDTLVYYDITATAFGWRPGMAAGRVLAQPSATIADVVACVPDTIGTAVFCLGVLASQPDPQNSAMADLLVGKLDGTLTPALSRVETVMAFNLADGDLPRFQVGFPSPGSDTIAWSARATPTGPEILKRQTIGNDASRATVASNVHGWVGSPNGSRWYWLSAVDDFGYGTLQSSPFPGGANPVTLGTDVVQFLFPAGQALLYADGSFQALAVADPVGAPTAVTTFASDVIGFIALSGQGDVGYVTVYDTYTMLSDLHIRRWNSTSGGCTLTSTADSLGGFFSPDSGAMVWVRYTNGVNEMMYSRLSDCGEPASPATSCNWTPSGTAPSSTWTRW